MGGISLLVGVDRSSRPQPVRSIMSRDNDASIQLLSGAATIRDGSQRGEYDDNRERPK